MPRSISHETPAQSLPAVSKGPLVDADVLNPGAKRAEDHDEIRKAYELSRNATRNFLQRLKTKDR